MVDATTLMIIQQLTIVRQLVRDLCVPVRVSAVPTVRERHYDRQSRWFGAAWLGTTRLIDTISRDCREPSYTTRAMSLNAKRGLRAGVFSSSA